MRSSSLGIMGTLHGIFSVDTLVVACLSLALRNYILMVADAKIFRGNIHNNMMHAWRVEQ